MDLHGSPAAIDLNIINMAKDKQYVQLMHRAEWVRLRRAKLTDRPLCERCEAEGRITPATEVHHVVPVETALTRADKERLAYDPHNLQALCHACHVQVHTEMGRSGRAQRKKRSADLLQSFVKKFLK